VAVAVVASPKASEKIPAIEQTLSAGAVCLGLVNAALAERLGGGVADRLAGLRPAAARGRARPRAGGMARGLRLRRDRGGGAAGPAAAGARGDRRMAVVGLAATSLKALGQLGDRRFAGVLLKGVGLTVLGLALATWGVVAGLGWLLPETLSLPWIGEVGFVDDVVSWAAVGLMLVLSVVLMVPVAAAVVGFFLDDIAAAVEARHYPALGRSRRCRSGCRSPTRCGSSGCWWRRTWRRS
jgi:hypothetical protein